MSHLDSLREVFVRMTEDGVFGDVQFDSIIGKDNSEMAPQFMSTVLFLIVRVKDKTSGVIREVALVVKVQHDNEAVRSLTNTDAMFANEVCMYQTVIPMLLGADSCDLFPKCYYSRFEGKENFKNDIVVLENLAELGFRAPQQKVFLDLPHLLMALEKIGEFHGLSYKFKQTHKSSDVLKNRLVCTKYCKSWFALVKPYLVFATKKYGNALAEQGYDKTLFEKLEDRYNDIEGLFKFINQPEEPFAVICHGDFNRNNLLFKYNDEGQPVAVKFFDLQNSVYSDPVLDLCFFLFMNANQAIREHHWDELLDSYWRGILASAPEPGFTRSEFFANFEKKAFLGFVEPSFFLPFMISGQSFDDLADYVAGENEAQIPIMDDLGGPEAYEAVYNIMKHLVDNKAVQNILEL